MTSEQTIAVGVLAGALALFAWGRWRYDVVAVGALLVSVVTGLVPADRAFAGLAHPAVVTVACVLVISYTLRASGVMTALAIRLTPWLRNETLHVAVLTTMAAFASAFMNNVAALSLMLPAAIATAESHRRSPSMLLMPISFGSLLGGMTTLIGTPPNLIVSAYRRDFTGHGFELFDYTPVGVWVAALGVVFVSILGWRLVPQRAAPAGAQTRGSLVSAYAAEAGIPEGCALVGQSLQALRANASRGMEIIGIAADDRWGVSTTPSRVVMPGDVLLLHGEPLALETYLRQHALTLPMSREKADKPGIGNLTEAIVMPRSMLLGRRVTGLGAVLGDGLTLVALARPDLPPRERIRNLRVEVGDSLLVSQAADGLDEVLRQIGVLPLRERRFGPRSGRRPALAIALFAAALVASALHVLSLEMALLGVIVAYVVVGALRIDEIYRGVDWSVVVLLGAFIPVGEALYHTGVTELIARGIVGMSSAWPAPFALALVLVVTMVLTEILNNATTALIMSPIAALTAQALGVAVDPFLIVVALGASCAFMTPIGHQSNTLVMGPGGYRFGDYWRMGLPLQLLIVALAVPLVAWVWPMNP